MGCRSKAVTNTMEFPVPPCRHCCRCAHLCHVLLHGDAVLPFRLQRLPLVVHIIVCSAKDLTHLHSGGYANRMTCIQLFTHQNRSGKRSRARCVSPGACWGRS